MVATHFLLLLAGVAGSNETVLLDFSMQGCQPCMQMRPVIARLQSEGYPVREVSMNTEPQLTRQYRVTSFPTMVLVHNGREVSRRVGYTSYSELVRMFDSAPRPQVAAPNNQLAGSPAPQRPTANFAAQTLAPPPLVSASNGSGITPQPMSAEKLARRATVRLQVEDSGGKSFATGTIIDVHNGEALIVTCGHVFRSSKGRGKITIDYHVTPAAPSTQGVLIDYKADTRDIAFVSCRLPVNIAPIRVAPTLAVLKPGVNGFTLGCDHGAPATIRPTQIVSLNRYTGPANIEIKGAPTQGRSGGGLFTRDGQIIGVCNAADNAADEGIYASLAIIHDELAAIGQRRLFDRQSPAPANSLAAPSRQLINASNAAAPINAQPAGPYATPARSSEIAGANRGGQQIIMNVAGEQGMQTMVLNNPSPALIQQMKHEYEQQHRGGQMADSNGRTVRAQSQY